MIRRLLDSFGAWRRGDKRVAPAGTTGRVFEREDNAGRHRTEGRGRASLKKTVIRKGQVDG